MNEYKKFVEKCQEIRINDKPIKVDRKSKIIFMTIPGKWFVKYHDYLVKISRLAHDFMKGSFKYYSFRIIEPNTITLMTYRSRINKLLKEFDTIMIPLIQQHQDEWIKYLLTGCELLPSLTIDYKKVKFDLDSKILDLALNILNKAGMINSNVFKYDYSRDILFYRGKPLLYTSLESQIFKYLNYVNQNYERMKSDFLTYNLEES